MNSKATRPKRPRLPSPATRELWMKRIGKSLSANAPLRPNKRTKTSERDENCPETRHRFLTTYKCKKIRGESGLRYGRYRENSHGDMTTVAGGSLYEDAKLYRMDRRQDAEIYEELYGISPFKVPKMHSETRALLNDHATALASSDYKFTPRFQHGFEEFVAALKMAGFPRYEYFRWNLNGNIEDEHPVLIKLRSCHWALERAFKNEVTYISS
ncbi:hypothetical protein ABOM_007012 [Aspergillus bombycis]|uniref:Uncharacterized protein n=1 Tax=Aspergillus bombycis TaxID=109264 RepID=A0A1F7ZXE2_9EURO|nr:hypothetical protein ABOM_007012 [Aspergillus bombycis]OGM44143.1 hypothetical protein ABOM_007012 [Aspergillus bombycis]